MGSQEGGGLENCDLLGSPMQHPIDPFATSYQPLCDILRGAERLDLGALGALRLAPRLLGRGLGALGEGLALGAWGLASRRPAPRLLGRGLGASRRLGPRAGRPGRRRRPGRAEGRARVGAPGSALLGPRGRVEVPRPRAGRAPRSLRRPVSPQDRRSAA